MNDVDVDLAAIAQQFVNQAAAEAAIPGKLARLADHNPGDVAHSRVTEQFLGRIGAGERDDLGAELFRQSDVVYQPLPRLGVQLFGARPLDVDGDPVSPHQACHALGSTDHARRHRAGADADQQPFRGGPGLFSRAGQPGRLYLGVDPLGHSPQCQFSQGGQIGFAEEVLYGVLGLGGHVDPTGAEPLQQAFGRQIDQLDLVGPLQQQVRHRFLHDHPGDLGDDVVEAFQVLDVQRRINVDTGVEQLIHVLPAFGVPAARRVCMRQLVDDDQRRMLRQRRVEIEFFELDAAILDFTQRHDVHAQQHGRRFAAAVRLNDADQHVPPGRDVAAGRFEHRIRLADAGREAEEQLQPASLGAFLLRLDLGQHRIGIGPLVAHGIATPEGTAPL